CGLYFKVSCARLQTRRKRRVVGGLQRANLHGRKDLALSPHVPSFRSVSFPEGMHRGECNITLQVRREFCWAQYRYAVAEPVGLISAIDLVCPRKIRGVVRQKRCGRVLRSD